MADASPVRVSFDIPRSDLDHAVTMALREQVRASLDEAIQAFRTDISAQLEGTKDKVDRTREQMDNIQDSVSKGGHNS